MCLNFLALSVHVEDSVVVHNRVLRVHYIVTAIGSRKE